jgi:acetyltransferase-like isoleucine patch superfamily enzyme
MIITNPEDNEIIGTPHIATKCSVVFKGKNNRLIIGANVRLTNMKIIFNGSNGLLEIQDGCNLIGDFRIVHTGSITVGKKTVFNKACWIQASDKTSVEIGSNCLFANVRIRTSDMHSIIDLTTNERINPDANVKIGNQVWLAENVYVYKGVTVGDGSIIGAGSIVVKSIPHNSLAVGVPAKVVKSNVSWNVKRL